MNKERFILTHIDGNRYTVTDTETGFAVTFTKGCWNTSQKVMPPQNMAAPDGQDAALWAASAMRAIGDYMATEHPDLVSLTPEQERRRRHFYETISDIGHSIRQLREYQGLTIDEAATASGFSTRRIENIEAGKLTSDLNVLTRIVERLGGRLAIVPEESPDDPHCQFIEFE